MKLGKEYIVPVLIIVIGIGWLMNTHGLIPQVDWVWTIGLATVGILAIAVGGINKVSIIVGPFMIIASFCSLLRQLGKLSTDIEVPVLTIIFGVLLLISHAAKLPMPDLLKEEDDSASQAEKEPTEPKE